jgi:hypothetical protein
MQIKIDHNDIGKVLEEFFPRANYADGKLRIELDSDKSDRKDTDTVSKDLELENTVATIRSKLSYGKISGELELNLDLNPKGIDCTITLK